RARDAYAEAGYREGGARLSLTVGDLHLSASHPREAASSFEDALGVYATLGVPDGQVTALMGLGRAAAARLDFDPAAEFYQRAAERATQVNADQRVRALDALAGVRSRQWRTAEEQRWRAEALELARTSGFRQLEGDLLISIGYSHVSAKRHDAALE